MHFGARRGSRLIWCISVDYLACAGWMSIHRIFFCNLEPDSERARQGASNGTTFDFSVTSQLSAVHCGTANYCVCCAEYRSHRQSHCGTALVAPRRKAEIDSATCFGCWLSSVVVAGLGFTIPGIALQFAMMPACAQALSTGSQCICMFFNLIPSKVCRQAPLLCWHQWYLVCLWIV